MHLAEVPWVSTAVAVYGSGRDSFRAGFAVLAGEIAAAAGCPCRSPGRSGELAAVAPRDRERLVEFLCRDEASCAGASARVKAGERGCTA